MRQPKTEKEIRCPLEYGLSVFGGKWKSRIICVLNEKGTLRYSALRGVNAQYHRCRTGCRPQGTHRR